MMEIKVAPDGFPIEQGFYNAGLLRMFGDMVATASPEIREEIRRRLEKAVHTEEWSIGLAKPYVDWSHASDLGDLYKGWGPNYLYVWLNKDGVPFYAGQAKDRNRVEHFTSSTRSEKFKKIVGRGGCHAVVVAKHIPDTKIDGLERELIAFLKWKEYPIVNEKDLPSERECKMAKKIADSSGYPIDRVFLLQSEYNSDFKKILNVLDEVVCAEYVGECATFAKTS